MPLLRLKGELIVMKTKYGSKFLLFGEQRLNFERRGYSYSQHIPERRSGHDRRKSAEAVHGKKVPSGLILPGYTSKNFSDPMELRHSI